LPSRWFCSSSGADWLGVSSLLLPLHGPGIKPFDLYMMMGTAVVLLPLIWSRFVITRWEVGLLATAYCGYVYVLWPK
jgi:Ca2+/Na+ antiporter